MTRTLVIVLLSGAALATAALPTAAQVTLERTLGLSGGWVGYPGLLVLTVPHRFSDAGAGEFDIAGTQTFEAALGLKGNLLAGARFSPESRVVSGEPDEWEVFGRYAPWSQFRGAPLDAAVTAAYNAAAHSVDAELSGARWFGALRAIGALRAMTSPYEGEGARYAVAAGGVFHPLPGALPIAVAGDVSSLLNGGSAPDVGWSAGVQIGLSFTPYTLSLFATNTATSSLEGLSRGGGATRFGFELTLPVPVGRFVGWYLPREESAGAVAEEPEATTAAIRIDVSRYLFLPGQIEIPVGAVVEWTNRDEVVHTVSSDNGTWDSGAIRPGARWSARFDRPGRYPYHCGPHPFMQGVVIVR